MARLSSPRRRPRPGAPPGPWVVVTAWLLFGSGCPTGPLHDDDRDDDTAADDDASGADDDTVDDDSTADDDVGDDDTTAPETSLYGNAFNADNLDNVELGPPLGRRISYRFRAERTGDVGEAMIYLVFAGPGYFAGTGGQVLLELQSDDGSADHLPSGTLLASTLVTDPTAQWNRLVVFGSPASLQTGELYHLVFSNPDPAPDQKLNVT